MEGVGRRAVLVAAGWLAAAGVATAIGIAAVRLIGDGITATGAEVLTPEQVAEQLSAAPPGTAQRSAAPSSPPAGPIGGPRPLSGPGGTVVAVCHADGRAALLSWTPAQGYQVERAERGPDEHAEVRFEGSAGRSQIRVRCVTGEPTAEWTD